MKKNCRAKLSPSLSKRKDDRYVMVDTETGEIVDDAQGYGYKSKTNAYRSFGYKQARNRKKGNK